MSAATTAPRHAATEQPRPEPPILFQDFFKSVGARTYAAQVKQASNGNHFIVLTEGKRDPKTEELRKSRLFVFSEDFAEFFKMLNRVGEHVRANPVPEEVRKQQRKFWGGANSKSAGKSTDRRPARNGAK